MSDWMVRLSASVCGTLIGVWLYDMVSRRVRDWLYERAQTELWVQAVARFMAKSKTIMFAERLDDGTTRLHRHPVGEPCDASDERARLN